MCAGLCPHLEEMILFFCCVGSYVRNKPEAFQVGSGSNCHQSLVVPGGSERAGVWLLRKPCLPQIMAPSCQPPRSSRFQNCHLILSVTPREPPSRKMVDITYFSVGCSTFPGWYPGGEGYLRSCIGLVNGFLCSNLGEGQ